MKRTVILFLLCIVLVGASLRLINLTGNPPGFFADEAVVGVDAYSVLHHGTDHTGAPVNFLFPALGDYRGFVQIVSVIPFVRIFGLTEFAIRCTSAIYGILTIVLIYAVTTIWFGDAPALFAAFLLAISPWHIHVSRAGWEIVAFPFWFLLALWLFLKSTKQTPMMRFLSAVAFGITLYTYQPARLFVPLFFAVLLCIFGCTRFKKEKWSLLFMIIIFLTLTIPLFVHINSGESIARLKEASVFFDTVPIAEKLTAFGQTYANYFSYAFLFTRGDSGFPGQFITRHSVPGLGLLYLVQLPFLVAGIIVSIRQWKIFRSQVLLTLLILYPVAGALVGNMIPFATRGIIGVIPMQILTAGGIYACFSACSRRVKWFIPIFAVMLMGAGVFSVNQYVHAWQQYPLTGANYWGWQYGAHPIMNYFLQHQSQYDELYLSPDGFNAPEIFIPFYDPSDVCDGKCHIGRPDAYDSGIKQLFAVPADRLNIGEPQNHVVKTVSYPDGQPAFYIFDIRR